MQRAQKTTNDPTASVGMSKNAAACKVNMARKTTRPPNLSERASQTSRPAASDTEITTIKAAARAAGAPPIEPAIALASERMASPAVVLRKKTAQRAYNCHVPRASRKAQASPPLLPRSAGPPASGRYLTNQA